MNDLARHWRLDPAVTFLNHGSFGACPAAVLDEQQRLRDRLEAHPVRFMMDEVEPLLAAAREELARFLGADADGLAFVTNATMGVNAVVRSLEFKPGDELVATDHGYNACNNAFHYVASRSGAKVVIAKLPWPVASSDDVVAALLAVVTPRTRLVMIDHITSPTAIILPVTRIVRELAARGIDTLVDGAHAPGMVPLDLKTIGAAYYTGNCHKWLCAPKGAAFLHVRADRRELIRPTSISHGANAGLEGRSRYRVDFDWPGTFDPTAALCVPHAIRFVGSLLPGGWAAVMEHNHRLALEGRDIVAAALGVRPPAPDAMLGSMAALPIRDAAGPPPPSPFGTEATQMKLYERHRIEVPIMGFPAWPRRLLRISAQLYNERSHYRTLADALRSIW